MENIYKIKIQTSPDPRWLYPSERRYSASIVLGLGVVHLALAGTALLLACLTLTANEALNNELPSTTNNTNASVKPQGMSGITINLNQGDLSDNGDEEQFEDTSVGKIENTTMNEKENLEGGKENSTNSEVFYSSTNLTLAPCLMCLGSLAAGLTGLLAWKRWYIDHNIKWFFCMSLLSTITSTVCLLVIGVIVIVTSKLFYNMTHNYVGETSKPGAKYVISVNILIASILEWLWSILSTKVAFIGMRNDYPDDIVISKSRGKIQVNTVHKGNNKKGKVTPPDILNHFPVSGKIAKYFPKKVNNNLPKEESNSEYQERVNRFLSSNVDMNSTA